MREPEEPGTCTSSSNKRRGGGGTARNVRSTSRERKKQEEEWREGGSRYNRGKNGGKEPEKKIEGKIGNVGPGGGRSMRKTLLSQPRTLDKYGNRHQGNDGLSFFLVK